MKRPLLILWVLTFLFCFASCDNGQEELEQLKAEYSKFDPYVDLIDALETNDFAAVDEIIAGYKAAAHNAQLNNETIREISIDSGNWFEYFEVKEITQWTKNDLNETTGFITHVCIVLKDEFAAHIDQGHSNVSFGWEAVCSVKNCDVDLENQIVTFENVFKSTATTFGEPEKLYGTVSFDGKPMSGEMYGNHSVAAKIGEIVIVGEYSLDGQMKPVCFDYDDTTIKNAEGILTLNFIGE